MLGAWKTEVAGLLSHGPGPSPARTWAPAPQATLSETGTSEWRSSLPRKAGGGHREGPVGPAPTRNPQRDEGRAVGPLCGAGPQRSPCWAPPFRGSAPAGTRSAVAGQLGQSTRAPGFLTPAAARGCAGLLVPSPGSLCGLDGGALSPRASLLPTQAFGVALVDHRVPWAGGRWLRPSSAAPCPISPLQGGLASPTEVSGARSSAPVLRGGGWWLPGPRVGGELGRPPCAPARAASVVRSSTPVGKLGPAWPLMNSHEGGGLAPVLLLDAAS